VKKYVGTVLILLLAAASIWSAPLSTEEQTAIITAYGIVTGQIHSSAAAEARAANLPPDKCGTSAVADFVINRDRLDPGLLKSLGVRLVDRPVLSKAYASPAGRFLIHYTTTGTNAVYQPSVRTLVDSVPDYVVMIARIADSAYTHEIDTLGYNPPPRDDIYPQGGDSLYDIYVVDLPEDLYGLTYLDFAPLSPGSLKGTSFVEIDNDYADISQYAARPLDAARVTIVHEYFHGVQFGIDFTEAENYDNPATRKQPWMEMSAVWMEEEVYDQINDYYNYVPFFLNRPTISLQAFGQATSRLHEYGAGLFPMYLSQRFGRPIIRDIWNRCGETAGSQFLQSCELAINAIDHDATLSTAMSEFAAWNYFTAGYASAAPAGVGYEERAAYPLIPVDAMLSVNRYPHIEIIDTGSYRPQYNGVAYLLLQELNARDSCHLIDTSADPDTLVPVPCDSVLPVWVFVQHQELIEWAISVIYQPSDPGQPFRVDNFVVPVAGGIGTTQIDVNCYHPNQYRSIAIAISPTTFLENLYSASVAPQVGYVISDSGRVVDRSTYAVLTPYPNPAVIATMAGRPLTFRFQVAADSTNGNVVGNPLLLIDLYTVGGDHVSEFSTTFENADRLHSGGLFEAAWDMKNGAGKDVASGVYLAYARLWDSPKKDRLLAESKAKVAVIR
jgi:hypothetical protein